MRKRVLLLLTVGLTVSCYQVTETDRLNNVLKEEKGTLTDRDGKEVSYDLKSGKDCFALDYSDEFNYGSVDELLAVCHEGTEEKIWIAQNDWNVHRDGVSVGNGRLGLWVKRVDDSNHPVVKENRRIAKTLCSGITYNREVKYGYIEAKLRMYKKKSSQYWPGFYTYVLKKDNASGKSIGGYEFDIFEPLDNKEINQTTHWPFSDSFRTSYKYAAPLEFEKWITASVAWTSEKVAYYLDGKLSYVFYNDNSNHFFPSAKVSQIRKGGGLAAENHKYQLVANLPQKIILVVAAGNGSASTWTGIDLEPVDKRPDGWEQLVYEFDRFRYFRYVGTEK